MLSHIYTMYIVFQTSMLIGLTEVLYMIITIYIPIFKPIDLLCELLYLSINFRI